MNRPIPKEMPLDRAADLIVRRGECSNFYQAKARIHIARVKEARKLQAKVAQVAAYRAPYAED